MSDLRAELDAVLRAVEPGPPPVEATMRRGRRLRSRRRLTALSGSLAVAVLAVAGYPVLGHLGSAAPGPAGPTGITATPGSSAGVVATGTIGGEHWRLSVAGSAARGLCFSGTVGRGSLGTACDLMAQPAGTPSSWHALDNGSYQGVITGVAPDVAYVVVTERDPQGLTELKLTPVSAGQAGDRFIGLVGPKDLDITSATVYLTNGQTAAMAQLTAPGWTRPGGDSPPVAGATLGQVNTDGQTWIVNAQEGSYGTCIGLGSTDGPGRALSCTPEAPMTALAAVGVFEPSADSPPIVYGSAPPAATSLRVTLTDGKSFDVQVRTVGTENLWAFGLGQGQSVTSWTAFSASGMVLGTGRLSPAPVSHSLVLPRLLREGR
jgi:hypothetical protein